MNDMSRSPAFAPAAPIKRLPAAEAARLDPGTPLLREPAVLTDAGQLMTEVWRWTPAYLLQRIGDRELRATRPGPDGRIRYEPGRTLDTHGLTLSQFLSALRDPDGPAWCLQQIPIEQELPELAAAVDHPSCVPEGLVNAVNLWMAAPGTTTPLHYDDTHNLFCQTAGSKTFYLFPPESLEALYPGPLNTGTQHLSRVDLFHPDLTRYPLARRLRYRTATVRAGEALILPAFWWHQVVTRDEVSVSVNFWWRADVRDCLVPGFMRQLQSAAVQHDLAALTGTFEFGTDPVAAAAELVALLADIGETRAAAALGRSVLRAVRDRPDLPKPARQLLAGHQSRLESAEPGASDEVARLAADLVTITSEGVRSW
jgi:hypothetical protein